MNKSLFLILFPLVACTGDKTDDSGTDSGSDTGDNTIVNGVSDPLNLVDSQWVLHSSEGFEPADDNPLNLRFFEASGEGVRMNLATGCNSVGGTLDVVDGKVSLPAINVTEMGCGSEALSQQEAWFIQFITSSPEIAKSGDNLIFTGADATLTYIDEELAVPDLPLVGTVWTVDSYIDGESFSAMNLENHPTISFLENGTLDVFSGCNSCDGSYTADAGTLTVTSFNCTEMECMDDLIQEAEQHVTSVFWGENLSFEIDATRLTVMSGDKGVSALGE